jgi:mannose-1-phosphate guanylyltransferase/phosphomannomutase
MKTKSRLTITLSQDLLVKVDALIDGHTIRNRSHAIESLVKQGLSSQVSTAVILAGGKHIKGKVPALKKINNRPLLALTLERLKNYGITQVIMCAGINEPAIREEFGKGSKLGINIIYSKEKEQLGTAGALKKAAQHIPDEPFLVINDTTLTNLNLNDLLEFQKQEDTVATICVKPRMSEPKYGQAYLHGNKITEFMDSSQTHGISIVNIGLYVLKPEILDLISDDSYLNLETDIFPKLAKEKELSAFVFQGSWFDASIDGSFNEAVKEFSK